MPSTQTNDALLSIVLNKNFQPDPEAFLLPLQSIEISANAPRKDYDEEQIEELIKDIKQKGILEPILVQKSRSFSDKSQKFLLISGHRRLRAASKIGLQTIPARIKPNYSDEEKLAVQLCENIQRKDLHPVEIALILRYFFELGLKEKEISEKVSKSLAWVSKYKKISKMPKQILEDPLALNATLSDLLSLESHFPKHTDLIKAWSVYQVEGLKSALQSVFDEDKELGKMQKVPDAPPRLDKMVGLTREFLIVTKNQNVLNCRMQIAESESNDISVVLPRQYSVEEIQEIFDKIIQSINLK